MALCREGAWDCWIGAIGERPAALPALADALAGAPAPHPPARDVLLAAAHADLAAVAPDLGAAERHRHAVNAVDAAFQAWDGLKP
jgi:hypothetical protein